jgi:hypothetical protein
MALSGWLDHPKGELLLKTEWRRQMSSNQSFVEARQRAESAIQTVWRDIATKYTVGWMGPIEAVTRKYPHMTQAIADIRAKISRKLPVIIYQTRESPPKEMVIAVPYAKHDNNPYNCRLATSSKLTPEEVKILNEFAQAFWFLIDNAVLPHPEDGSKLEHALVKLTNIILVRVK